MPLSALASQALVAFAVELDNEFEHQMPHRTTNHGSTPGVARAPWLVANVVRVIDDRGVRVRDLPALTGVAKIGIENQH